MKRTIIILLVNFALADALADEWSNGISVSTNVDGVVLALEFADVSVIAGERLAGRMVVSNATNEIKQMHVDRSMHNTHLDTDIGQFVVMDDEGNQLSRTFWRRPPREVSSMIPQLKPGKSMAFEGDLVKKYSLTNPGIYLVKAVARVPTPENVQEDMVIETLFVAVTVLRRPEGMPAPAPLHTAYEIANTVQGQDAPQLQVTHPKPDATPRVPRAVPRDGNSQAAVMPPKVAAQPKNTFSATPDQPAPTTRTRNVFYALAVLLLVGGLGIYLWSRRKHGHP